MFVDQADMLANAYINAATQGNDGAAALLGDHFSEDRNFNQKMFALDFQRDSDYLNGAQITGMSLERTQSLSGQWMTVARFQYRPLGSTDWHPAELRVKTASWLCVTYIRAVESVEQ